MTKSSKSTAFLIALDSCFSNREYGIGESGVIIGRDQERSNVVVSDKKISRQHMVVKQGDDGEFLAIDLNSTNGVFVNRQRVHGQDPLSDGDIIGLGSPQAVHLRFQSQSNRNKAVAFRLAPQEAWTIGRNDNSDISLPFDPTISAAHARITNQADQLFLYDLSSLNGTFLNGQKVRRARVQTSDTVVIGSTYFHFRLTGDRSLAVSQRESGDDIQLECVELQRDVPVGKGKTKCILHDITLQINPGEFIGILGPSGAGKSTLLKAVCGHTAPDSGCVLLNETPLYRSYDMFRSVIGYVPQDDILHSELSVKKSLDYIARLRLPRDMDTSQRETIVQTTIEALGLSHVRSSKIEQLSGGQRKRVSIGAELITRPSILFLDEPTSGLDPSVEERLMRHFQDMANKGTTILITTHILYNLSMLDKIIVMAQGRIVFYGTPGEALDFFSVEDDKITEPTQLFDLLEGISRDILPAEGAGDGERKEIIAKYYSQKYLESSYFKKHIVQRLSPLAADMCSLTKDKTVAGQEQNSQLDTLLATPLAGKWSVAHLKRCFSLRQWKLLSSRHLQIRFSSVKHSLIYLLIPAILALVTLTQTVNGFLDEGAISAHRTEIANAVNQAGKVVERQLQVLLSPDGEVGEKSATGLIYMIKHEGVINLPVPMGLLLMFVMTSIFMGTFIACQEISTEKSIRHREQMAGQRILDYIGSKLSFCCLVTAIQCTLYLGICYLDPGLRPVPFQDILPVLILLAWTSVAIGLFLSAIDPSSGQLSIILAIVIVLPQLILSGGLGPDFYLAMNKATKFIADFFPSRWGLELFLTATYFNEAGRPLIWVPDFITNEIGFDFGHIVYKRDMFFLMIQMVFWLFITVLVLRKNKY